MKVVVENTPNDSELNSSFLRVLESFTRNEKRTPDVLKEWLESFYGGVFFFYLGGSHIAIHERDTSGEPMEQRLIIVEL